MNGWEEAPIGPAADLAQKFQLELEALGIAYSEDIWDEPFADLGLDSFAIVCLVVALEAVVQRPVSDAAIESARCLNDIVRREVPS